MGDAARLCRQHRSRSVPFFGHRALWDQRVSRHQPCSTGKKRIHASIRRRFAGAFARFPRSVRTVQIACLSYEVCGRSEEHTSELQSLMRISYAVCCLKKKKKSKEKT